MRGSRVFSNPVTNVIIYEEIHDELNKTDRFWIAHTEQEIGVIIGISIYFVKVIIRPVLSGLVTNI